MLLLIFLVVLVSDLPEPATRVFPSLPSTIHSSIVFCLPPLSSIFSMLNLQKIRELSCLQPPLWPSSEATDERRTKIKGISLFENSKSKQKVPSIDQKNSNRVFLPSIHYVPSITCLLPILALPAPCQIVTPSTRIARPIFDLHCNQVLSCFIERRGSRMFRMVQRFLS